MQNVKKSKEYQYMPFIVDEQADIPGGKSIALSELRRDIPVAPGAFLGEDATGLGHILKSVEILENATETAKVYKVKKGHHFLVGNFISSKDKEAVKAYAITAIDISNAEYDTITVGTTLGVALTAGDNLIEVKAKDATGGASELPYTPIGISKNEIDTSASHDSTGVLTHGTVNVPNMAFGAPKVYRDLWIHTLYRNI